MEIPNYLKNIRMPRARRLLSLLFFALTGLPSAHAQSLTATIKVGTGPGGVAVNSMTNKIYVANPGINSATIIDGASNSAVTIPIAGSNEPAGFAINSTTNKIYVANGNDNAVSIIDGATNSTTYVIIAGAFPLSVAVNSTTNKIYVSDGFSDNVTIIDGATNATTTLALGGGPGEIAVNSVTNKIYAITYGATSGYLTVIDGATNSTTTVAVRGSPGAIALNPVTNKIYLITYGATSGSLTVIDGATNTVTATVPLPGVNPIRLAINTVTNKIYVATYLITSDSDVAVIDGATNSITTVALGYAAPEIVVDPVTNKIFAPSAGLDGICRLTVIDGLTNSTTSIETGMCNGADEIAVNPVTDTIYASNSFRNTVAVINGAASTSAPTITAVANAEGQSPTIALNTWVEIKGTNLAPANDSRTWQPSDFANNQMPTELDGVSASVNGKDAYIYYISPTQVNILTPPNVIQGPVTVVLANGAASTAFTAQAQPLSPSFFVFDGVHVAGVHLDGSDIGPATLYPGQTTPAKPGEAVELFANGFGPTSEPVIAGSTTQSGSLSPLPAVKIGGIPATVLFAGLVAPGEFQFNVVVPSNAPDGDQLLTATCDGLQTQSGVVITIQQ
jgi:uncharacterized protein (TIGR03437 family)